MIYPTATRLVICIAYLFYGVVCFVDMFMMPFASVKWLSNRHGTPLHSLWENPFLSLPLFFKINPPGHSKLLWYPTVCLLCLSAAAHLFGFYGLCFSLGSVYAWLDPALLKWWRGLAKCLQRRSFIRMMCLCLLFPFVISSQQPDREIWAEWQVNVSPTDLFSPRSNMPGWLTVSICCIEPGCLQYETD